MIDALSAVLGQEAKARPGRQHMLDAAYFARVDAIQFTIAHDDGIGSENWEEADILLAGVSRTSKTPTSIYLANRGYKVANIPLVPESPPPQSLYGLRHPLVVGLTTNPDRLIQIRRNRLLSLNQAPETDYVDQDAVDAELAFARRMFADNGWPVIDVTRRSIEETAVAIINLVNERRSAAGKPASAHEAAARLASAARRAMLKQPACRSRRWRLSVDEEAAKAGLRRAGIRCARARRRARRVQGAELSRRFPPISCSAATRPLERRTAAMLDKPAIAGRGGRTTAVACAAPRTGSIQRGGDRRGRRRPSGGTCDIVELTMRPSRRCLSRGLSRPRI